MFKHTMEKLKRLLVMLCLDFAILSSLAQPVSYVVEFCGESAPPLEDILTHILQLKQLLYACWGMDSSVLRTVGVNLVMKKRIKVSALINKLLMLCILKNIELTDTLMVRLIQLVESIRLETKL